MKSRLAASLLAATLLIAMAPAAGAQEVHTDPSTQGTTGLFTIPLASVLDGGEFHAAAFFYGEQVEPGDSSIEYSGLAFAVAFDGAPGFEIFGMFEPRIGVHRNYTLQNLRGTPHYFAPRLDDHPLAVARWDTGIGDLYVGGKYRFLGDPGSFTGLALMAQVKLPTSDTDAGIGTGKLDFRVGFAGSAEIGETVGLSTYFGGAFRGSPDEVEIGNKFEYGVGLQVPTRFWISAIVEFSGMTVQDKLPVAIPLNGGIAAGDDPLFLTGGFRISHDSGIALDAAYMKNVTVDEPAERGDTGFVKLSYTNSRTEPVVFVGAAPMDLPPFNRPPTLRIRAERTSVRTGESVRLFADVSDPDGDNVTVTWNTQAGSINPREGETVTWSSQGVRPGSGPVTARADDGYGGTADAELTLTVTAPPPPPEPTMLTFSCSEFPSGNTRIDNRCKAILDDVALQMRQNPRATAVITGHSDSAGSDEVNNRMSLERADNAETYLVDTHGIDGSRIETASAGSSEPIADNASAEGRLQNRRIVVVITIPAQ